MSGLMGRVDTGWSGAITSAVDARMNKPGLAGMWARAVSASPFYQPGGTSAPAAPAADTSASQPMGGSAPQQRKRQAGAQSLASTDILGG